MKKAELMGLLGYLVEVTFLDGKVITGRLGYTETFSEKYNFRKSGYFTVQNYDFLVSHIKKIKVIHIVSVEK